MAFESIRPGEFSSRNSLVIDNSVMMRWLVDDGSASERSYAAKILEYVRTEESEVLVPYIWVYESAYVVNFYVSETTLEPIQAKNHLDALFDLCTIAIDRKPPTALFGFSQDHGVSAYDAAYLLLSLSSDSQLATLDKKMRRVALNLAPGLLLE